MTNAGTDEGAELEEPAELKAVRSAADAAWRAAHKARPEFFDRQIDLISAIVRAAENLANSQAGGYTVIGLRGPDGELTVAGVIKGDQTPMADLDPGEEGASRWAQYLPEATDPEHAEEIAHGVCGS